MRRAITTVLAGLLVFMGCSSAGMLAPSGPFDDITKLAVPDLQRALAKATAADDKPAMMCYPVLIEVVQGLEANGIGVDLSFQGPAEAFENTRLLAKKAQSFTGATNPLIQKVNLGCAALYNDAKGDVLRLGIKFRS